MKILIACEYSGTVRDAFKKRGHDVISCDILPTDKPGKHYQGPVEDILYKYDWGLIVAHPPCTYLTNSGVCHLYHKGTKNKNLARWAQLDDGAKFFKLFLSHPCKKVAIENPIPHKYAVERIGAKYTQIVQPWQFGHTERKATCFWLKGLPKLQETNNVKSAMLKLPKSQQQRLHYLSPGPNRWKMRSKTFQGIADAMAAQWS